MNGFLVYWLKVPAIIITIATLNLFYGLLVYATNGTWLYGFPDWFMNGINWFSFQGADGYDYGLTLPLLCLLATIVVTGVLMNRTRLGRQIYAMGGNRDAASRLGLNLLRLHFASTATWAFWPASRRWCRRRSQSVAPTRCSASS